MLIFDQLRKDNPRLRLLAVVVLAAMAVLLGGLWNVQILGAKRYENSLKSQTYRLVRVPAIRGKLLDRHGAPLAENRPNYSLNLYIEELRPLFDQQFSQLRRGRKFASMAERNALRATARYLVVSNTVQQLGQLLGEDLGLTEKEFKRHHQQWPYRPLTLQENLNAAQVARFLEQAPNMPGVDLEILPARFYTNGPAVAHALGYLMRDDQARDEDEGGFNYSLPTYMGALGLEYAFEPQLAGKAGLKSVLVNSLCYRESETTWTASEPGQNVVLTLDTGVQRAAYEALRSVGSEVRGAAVVMDCLTGDVLALVSAPAYDPNEFVAPIGADRWHRLNDPHLKPMFNRATQGAYPPGSIFKMVTALACLESGVLNAGNLEQKLYNPGYYQLGRRRIDDTAAPGEYDFQRAFKRSSNTYFITYGLKAGRQRILELGKRFFLGERIGLGTKQEAGGAFPTPEDVEGLWSEGNVANLCIGQEITATPLQMAVVTAAVANGGKILTPRLVSRVEPNETPASQPPESFPVRVRGELGVQARYLDLIRAAMRADVEEADGTGHLARVPGMNVCGKTGTAQITQGTKVVDHITWFASYAPYENPRFVVVVMVESGGSGGSTCAPVARQIFAAIQKRLPPPAPAAPRLAEGRGA